jgi:hypothetical protein
MYLPHVCKLSVTCKQLPRVEVKEFGFVESFYVKALMFTICGDLEILL